MNGRGKYYLMSMLVCLLAAMAWAGLAVVGTARAAAGAVTAPAPQEIKALQTLKTKLTQDGEKLAKLLHGVSPTTLLSDAKLRAKIAPQAIPIMRDIVDHTDQFASQFPAEAAYVRYLKFHYLAILELFGDAAATKTLDAAAHSQAKTTVIAAQLSRLAVQWAGKAHDAAGQKAILSQVDQLVKIDPQDDDLTVVVYSMARGAADKTVEASARDVLLHKLQGPLARMIQKPLTAAADQPGPEAQQGLLNKPFVLQGTTLDGKPFSTVAWKGKVVFVDFWATWCPPCRASIPHDETLYEKSHKTGLEIVGVSSDNGPEPLRQFLKQHPKMVWPELFEPGQHGWSPIAGKYNVTGIPTQFIIDRQGVLRYIVVGYAPDQVEQDISAVLAQQPATPAQKP